MTIELGAVRKVVSVAAAPMPVSSDLPTTTRAATQPERPIVQIDALVAARTPPIDHDRVAKVRHAVARGEYPILPMKVADALIAASMLLNVAK